MPVSHIGLTVSHLPTSCSFFLAALQPLGYRYIGQQGNQVGFGTNEADFFICQETTGAKAGAAHIAFSAPDRVAVRDFYTAALTAGGVPHGAPACRNEENGYFNAAVLDFDGNSIEVVYREDREGPEKLPAPARSRVLDWRTEVSGNLSESGTVVSRASAPSVKSTASQALTTISAAVPAASIASTVRQAPPTPPAAPSAPAQPPTRLLRTISAESTSSNASKTIIGTLLGAAAGAAVAYAMCKSEQDSAKSEHEFEAFQITQTIQRARPSPRRAVTTESIYPSRTLHQEQPVRAIEAPPLQSVHEAPFADMVHARERLAEYSSYMYVQPTRAAMREPSTSGSSVIKHDRSQAPTLISSFVPSETARTMPLMIAAVDEHDDSASTSSRRSSRSKMEAAAAKAASKVSRAPSEHVSRAPSEHHSRAPSAHVSRAPSPSRAPTHISKAAPSHISAAPSMPPSLLSRTYTTHPNPINPAFHIVEVTTAPRSRPSSPAPLSLADLDIDDATVVPSDSVSQIGSSPSRRHRKHRDRSPSGRSHHSSHSKSSRHSSGRSSKHARAETVAESRHEGGGSSHHSHRSRRDSHQDSPVPSPPSAHSHPHSHAHSHVSKGSASSKSRHKHRSSVTGEEGDVVVVKRVVSEAGSTSTVKPIRREGSVATFAG